MDLKAMLQAIETNAMDGIQRVTGKLGISQTIGAKCWIIFGISCLEDHHFYLWTFPPAAGISGKKWPIRDEDWKHLKSIATILKYSTAGHSFYQKNIFWITNTGFFEQKF